MMPWDHDESEGSRTPRLSLRTNTERHDSTRHRLSLTAPRLVVPILDLSMAIDQTPSEYRRDLGRAEIH